MSKHNLFVYGTLKKGYWNNQLLKDSKFVGDSVTKNKYALYTSGIPFLSDIEEVSKVHGELYEIDSFTLERCDRLEGHPTFYTRKEIPIIVNNAEVLAWCYICNKFNRNSASLLTTGSYEHV